jgi:hypothetical protein
MADEKAVSYKGFSLTTIGLVIVVVAAIAAVGFATGKFSSTETITI